MPQTATKVRDLRKDWHPGSALYRVDPPIEVNDLGVLKNCYYVIVAVTPEASDHRLPETAVFPAKADGKLYVRHCDWAGVVTSDFEKGSYNDLGIYVVGEINHEKALSQLQGGYKIK